MRPDLTLSDHYIDADETICGGGGLDGAVEGVNGAAESFGEAVKGLNGAAESFGGVKGLDGAAESFGEAVKGLNGAAEGLGSSSACSLFVDYRDAIRPKHPLPDAEFEARPYYQVRAQRHGFLPNLSVLDLLFNEGPEGIFWLI